LAIGLVSVAASEAWVITEMRMPAMAGSPVGVMAVVLLEAFVPITMTLAFSDKNESARGIPRPPVEGQRGDRQCPRR
jgi:hypothetical protein